MLRYLIACRDLVALNWYGFAFVKGLQVLHALLVAGTRELKKAWSSCGHSCISWGDAIICWHVETMKVLTRSIVTVLGGGYGWVQNRSAANDVIQCNVYRKHENIIVCFCFSVMVGMSAWLRTDLWRSIFCSGKYWVTCGENDWIFR